MRERDLGAPVRRSGKYRAMANSAGGASLPKEGTRPVSVCGAAVRDTPPAPIERRQRSRQNPFGEAG